MRVEKEIHLSIILATFFNTTFSLYVAKYCQVMGVPGLIDLI